MASLDKVLTFGSRLESAYSADFVAFRPASNRDQPEIEIVLEYESRFQAAAVSICGRRSRFQAGRSRFQAGRSRFQAGWS